MNKFLAILGLVAFSSMAMAQSCPTLSRTATATVPAGTVTRLTGMAPVNYFGGGIHPEDMTSFASVMSSGYPPVAFPSAYDSNGFPTLSNNNYLSLAFTVPQNFLPTLGKVPFYGQIGIGQSSFSARVSMTISTNCGDFSNPSSAGSSVVAGCYLNSGASTSLIMWTNVPGKCNIQNGQSYYLNVIVANISNVTPTGGTVSSTIQPFNKQCSNNSCTVPLVNGPGNWHK